MNKSVDSIVMRITGVRARLSMLTLAASLAAGCGVQNHTDAPPPPPPSATVGILGAYRLDTVGTQPSPITVRFTGTLVTATGSAGATSFDVSVDQIIPGHVGIIPETVSFKAGGLKQGSWTVTAQPNCCAGAHTCRVNIPGQITIDVSGGMGPHCL